MAREDESTEDEQNEGAGDDVPCPPMFATETMAELSARQGRSGDAAAIYRHLVRTAEAEAASASVADARGAPAGERLVRWKARLAELERGAPSTGTSAAPAPRAAPRVERAAPRATSLVIREPVRSGQIVYADGRDLIVVASVHSGAQLLADGNIHVYGVLKGRAVAGARGQRDAQVFCLALEAELVGVDTGYVLSDDLPPALWGAPARVSLTAEGTCSVVALLTRTPGPGWQTSSRPRPA